MKKFIIISVSFLFCANFLFAQNLSTGLIAYYSFNGNANDESGNNYHGVANGATLTTDQFGNQNSAYYFDGIDDCILLNPIGLQGCYSIRLLLKPEDVSSSTQELFISNGFSSNTQFVLRNDGSIGFDFWPLDYLHTTDNHIVNNYWYDIVLTRDSLNRKIFINGIEVASATTNLQNNDSDGWSIGGQQVYNQYYYKGIMDEIRVYNRQLSVNEINELYYEGNSSTITQESLGIVPFAYGSMVSVPNTVDGNIYLLGGRVGGSVYISSDTIWKYNLAQQNWSPESYYLPYGIDYSSASYLNDHIYMSPGFATGNSNGWGSHNKMIDVDLSNQMASETHAFTGFSSIWFSSNCEYNGKIYFIGGHNGSDQTEIFEYDPISDTLIHVSDLLNATTGATVFVGSDNWIYILGHHATNHINQRFNPLTYQTELLSTSMKSPCNFWHIENNNELYYFYRSASDTLVYKYNYILDVINTTEFSVHGQFENVFSISHPSDPRVIYSLKVNSASNQSDELVKLTLNISVPPVQIIPNFIATNTNAFVGDTIQLTDLSTGNPISWLWDFGDSTTSTLQNPLYIYSSAGQYDVSLIVSNGTTSDTLVKYGYIQVDSPVLTTPDWSYTITSTNHTILIHESTPITINGIQIEPGDYVGVFYDSLGTLNCGGYRIWESTSTTISAWGEDIGNDGFVAGKQFKWKIWDASENIVYDVYATYIPISINNQIFNQGNFAVNGISGLSSLSTRESQEIVLPYGWSIFSTYINPINSSFDTTFNEIVSNVEIVKNYLGQTYWPFYGVNLIGNISICEGYQIKMNLEDTLIITGLSVHPENTNCDIPAEWSIISYLRKSPSSVVDMMSTIVSDIVIVKDYLGEIYWPLYGVNSIGNMDPGEGYQIKMLNATTLTYPANTANVSKSNIQILKPNYFKGVKNTGSNMTLGIPKTAWEIEPQIGDEIGIFCENGKLVGSSVFIGENLAISIWANDDLTEEIDGMIESEKFIIRIWGGENEQILEIENWLEGDEFYGTNKISVAEKLSTFQLSTFQLHQNTPNPFSENTEISFYIYENAFVEIELFDILGEKIETIQAQNYPAGNHSIVYDKKNLQSGVYFYRLSVKDFSATKSLSIF